MPAARRSVPHKTAFVRPYWARLGTTSIVSKWNIGGTGWNTGPPLGVRKRPTSSRLQLSRLGTSHAPCPGMSRTEYTHSDLVTSHMGLVKAIACRLFKLFGGAVDLDDLVSMGSVGLMQAAARYRPDSSTTFSTFAYYRIRGAIYDGIKSSTPIPRATDRDVYETSELACPSVDPCEATEARRSSKRLDTALHHLPAQRQRLLREHYYGGKSLLDAGRDLGISKSWASRLHSKALSELRIIFEKMGSEEKEGWGPPGAEVATNHVR